MDARKVVAMLGMAVAFAACVPSIHPLYTDKDLVFKDGLLGTWIDEDSLSWAFQKEGDKAYKLTLTNDEWAQPAVFDVYLVQLKDYLFLDMYPHETGIDNDWLKFHLIPAHTFWTVRLEEGMLKLGVLNYKWLDEELSKRWTRLAHERVDDMIIMTAPTKKLQKFFLKHADDPEAFEIGELHRAKQPA